MVDHDIIFSLGATVPDPTPTPDPTQDPTPDPIPDPTPDPIPERMPEARPAEEPEISPSESDPGDESFKPSPAPEKKVGAVYWEGLQSH